MNNKFKLLEIPPHMESEEAARKSINIDVGKYGDISVGSDTEVLWMTKLNRMDGSNRYKFYSADSLFVKAGIYGTDGRTLQGEWRFTPAYDVNLFMDIVREAMVLCKTFAALRQRSSETMPNIYPYGMGIYPLLEHKKITLPESIGLHIHLGNRNMLSGDRLRAIAAFDVLLAPAVKLFESEIAYNIRTNCGFYGDLSDYESKEYGLEYKTLPSCIDDPDVFAGCFAVAKAIAFEVMCGNFNNDFLSNFKIRKDDITNKSYLRVLAKQAQLVIKRRCRFYYVYKDIIDKFFEKALSKNPEQYFSTLEDIFSIWDIECDFSDGDLCRHMQDGALFTPDAAPICGYKDGDDETLPKAIDFVSQHTFSINNQRR